jgi:Holliday junction resolvasome RuvABC ATP-dependent DNA helicase subunit
MFRNKIFTSVVRSFVNQRFIPAEERFFDSIVGYSDLKKLLMKAIVSKEQIHILLTGPPATSKTVFLLEMHRGIKNNVYFVDGTSTSGAGMIDFLFDNPNTEYLLIDEVDKINKRDQTALYNVMESGIISETKSAKAKGYRQRKIKLKIFATANELEKLQKPFKSRFMEFYLPEYTWEEFLKIAKKLLQSRYELNEVVASRIAEVVWTDMQTKDVRDVLQIAKLTGNNIDDVQDIARTMMKYGNPERAKN